ncbi:CD3337/EF1877 family mobilome membrane protein [Clostridiisalibacter paucivorans]|uniref:CD3337/EF1877 family mobilome membrane protein n=1 Tax=Clostridiisalibacter paucivorans TaxID=408753 RepID=UPI00047B7560|nr:hypothetical protein [Clostridiisalibacter paucivorans]
MKKLFIFLTILYILFSSASFAYASYDIQEDPVDGVFSSLKKYYSDLDSLENSITKYKSSNYYLDIKEYSTLFDPIKKLISNVNSINNLLFALQKMICKITIFIMLFAYKADLYDMFGNYIDMIIEALKIATFDKVMLTIVALIGLYSIIATVVADRKATVLNNAIKTIVILTCAFIFMNNPTKYLTEINDFSVEVSDDIFKATYGRYKRFDSKSNDALVSAGGMIWDVMVHKPWQALVLGGTSNEKLTRNILQNNPYDDDRVDEINDLSEDNSLLRLEGIFTRFGTLILFLIFSMVLSIIIIILSALSIVAQVMVTIFSLLAPFIFTIALIPRFSNVLGGWAIKMAGYSFIKIFVSLFLSLLLVINAVIFTNIDSNGLIVTLILMAVVTFSVYHSREKIAAIIKAVPKGERNIRREIKSPSKAKERIKDYQSIVSGYTKDKAKKVSKGVNTTARKTLVKTKGAAGDFYSRKKQQRYKEMANEYLNRKYNEQKRKSEFKAHRLGRDKVNYTDFVKEADTREKLGKKKFTESQINQATKIIRKLELEGEDPQKFVKGEEENIIKSVKPFENKLNVKSHISTLSNKDIQNRIDKLNDGINKKQEVVKNSHLAQDNKDKEIEEIYKLWQKKFELQNNMVDRNINKNDKKYSRYKEYDELKEVRKQINSHIKDMSKIFNEDFKGNKNKAFNKELDTQIKLKGKQDKLIDTLKNKDEFASIRNRASYIEEKILNEFGRDKIQDNNMLLNDKEDYIKELDKLKDIYESENMKIKELKDKGIDVNSLNGSLTQKFKLDTKETEELLLNRTKELANEPKDFKKEFHQDVKNQDKEERKMNNNQSYNQQLKHKNNNDHNKEKIVKEPIKIEQKLDVNRLAQRDEETVFVK